MALLIMQLPKTQLLCGMLVLHFMHVPIQR